MTASERLRALHEAYGCHDRRWIVSGRVNKWGYDGLVIHIADGAPICFLEPEVHGEDDADAALIVALRNAAPEIADLIEAADEIHSESEQGFVRAFPRLAAALAAVEARLGGGET